MIFKSITRNGSCACPSITVCIQCMHTLLKASDSDTDFFTVYSPVIPVIVFSAPVNGKKSLKSYLVVKCANDRKPDGQVFCLWYIEKKQGKRLHKTFLSSGMSHRGSWNEPLGLWNEPLTAPKEFPRLQNEPSWIWIILDV
jgi:hypothetical protein